MKNFIIARNTIPVIFLIILTSCLTYDPLKMPFKTYTPPNLGDGWDISSPDAESIDGDVLKNIYQYVHSEDNLWQIRSLLVFRNGKLVAESYMKDNSDRTTPRVIWSCTKQVTGILTGIAVNNDLISINDTIQDHLPKYASRYPNKSHITIEHLLTMKSGIDIALDGSNSLQAEFAKEKHSSSLDYIFGLGMHSQPGTRYRYNDGDPFILSAIIQAATGKAMRDWGKEVLFDRIGINNLRWLNYKDGITFGGYGIYTTPRELGKFGQLILNDGWWNSKEIVSLDWINLMLTKRVPGTETFNSNMSFGYQWWIETDRDLYIMWGYGGQLVLINKHKDLIVVVTGENRLSGDFNMSLPDVLAVYDRINSIAN